jgi:hypothetical protein
MYDTPIPQLSVSSRLLVVRKGNRSLFYRIVFQRSRFVAVLQFQTKVSRL